MMLLAGLPGIPHARVRRIRSTADQTEVACVLRIPTRGIFRFPNPELRILFGRDCGSSSRLGEQKLLQWLVSTAKVLLAGQMHRAAWRDRGPHLIRRQRTFRSPALPFPWIH